MSEPLPAFRYHPDPVGTSSIAASEKECRCCGRSRGYIYTLAPYTDEGVDEESVCPWCIADGSAHAKLQAEFIDPHGIPDDVPEAVAAQLVERTPGYASWQTEEWRACCDDAAAYLGPFGYMEIMRQDLLGELMAYIMDEMQYQGRRASLLAESLHRDHGPTAYVFRCLHCEAHLFHIDFP